MSSTKKGVIIGVDPHKMSVTIEVVDPHERLLGGGRFDTTNAGYAAMQRYVKQWPDRLWAVRTRSSTLRISHFPDPRSRRYADHQPAGRPLLRAPVDTEGCHIRTLLATRRRRSTVSSAADTVYLAELDSMAEPGLDSTVEPGLDATRSWLRSN